MPLNDPQFWLVTLAAGWGAFTLLRQLVPSTSEGGSACGSCALGTAACARHESAAGGAAGDPSGVSPAGAKLVVLRDR